MYSFEYPKRWARIVMVLSLVLAYAASAQFDKADKNLEQLARDLMSNQ